MPPLHGYLQPCPVGFQAPGFASVALALSASSGPWYGCRLLDFRQHIKFAGRESQVE